MSDCILQNRVPYERQFARHPKSEFWYQEKNGNITPDIIYIKTNKKYWFICETCNHEFAISPNNISNISRGRWCPYCSGQQICNNECKLCFEKSFASHEKAKYWSKNNILTPREVFIGTIFTYLFMCETCNHEFPMSPNNISKGQWCSYCNGNHKICDSIDCKMCFERSFASHEKVKYWSNKNVLTPRQVFKCSKQKCIFNCNCGHEIEMSLTNVVGNNNWCSYCAHQKLCENNECKMCFENSFASHEKSNYIFDKTINTRQIFKSSSAKNIEFICNVCDFKFPSMIANISKGSWCPMCKNKTEKKLYEVLKPIYPTLIKEFRKNWCKDKNPLPFDFCIPELKIIIELDGQQHFCDIKFFQQPFMERHKRDIYKEKCANENEYHTIRVLQEDVFFDKINWLEAIKREIENIKNDDTIIHNIYISKNNEYDIFM